MGLRRGVRSRSEQGERVARIKSQKSTSKWQIPEDQKVY